MIFADSTTIKGIIDRATTDIQSLELSGTVWKSDRSGGSKTTAICRVKEITRAPIKDRFEKKPSWNSDFVRLRALRA